MADNAKLPVGNVVVYNKNLELFKLQVRPFLDKYIEENGKYPTWDVLDITFKSKINGMKFRGWLGALIRRYRDEWKDELSNPKKKNNNYNPSIAGKLQERFDAILAVSPSLRGEQYTEEETAAIVDML